ncbi:MAG: Uma2 family endonuclease [Chloroflexi bacterium]|nr:Uma2 family endonuclease [Chloroflexota bacterium]
MGVLTKPVLPEAIQEVLPASTLEEGALRRRVLEVLLDPVEVERMSYEAFLASFDEDTYAEWVNGEIIMMSPANDRHQDLSGFLESVLRSFVETHDLGIVRSAPFQMRLADTGREPDLLFVAQEHLDRLRKMYLDGPADLAVEIVSPESMGRDRGEKFYEYEAAGVREYWLIDPERERAEFYRLEEGRYRLVEPDTEGRYHSAVLEGFWLQVDWLWEEPLPRVLDVLRELQVI